MKMTDLFAAQLEREAAGTRRTLERVPEGRNDWKPHEKSMPLGYLAGLVAQLPAWVSFTVDLDEIDLSNFSGSKRPRAHDTNRDLLQTFEESMASARKSLAATHDDHLLKPWRFAMGGKVVSEQPRYHVLSDAVFGHLAHHRGQLTVYLRLLGAPVPAIYGPSADEGRPD